MKTIDAAVSASPEMYIDGCHLFSFPGAAPIGNPAFSYSTSTLESCTFNTATGNDQLIVDASNGLNTDINFVGGSAGDQLSVTGIPSTPPLNVQPGCFDLNTASIASTNVGAVDLLGSGASMSLNTLYLSQNVALVTAQSLVLKVLQLSIASSATFDAGDNDLIIQQNPAVSPHYILALITSGFNSGNWNGSTGIVSSAEATDPRHLTALGYRQSNGTNFDNQLTTPSDVLVKYTYYGDADLNGVVNGADYQQIDNGFGIHQTGWSNGDFNYDGFVDGGDFSLIDNAFNQITAIGASPLALLDPSIVASPPNLTSTPPRGSANALTRVQAKGENYHSPFASSANITSAASPSQLNASDIDDILDDARGIPTQPYIFRYAHTLEKSLGSCRYPPQLVQ